MKHIPALGTVSIAMLALLAQEPASVDTVFARWTHDSPGCAIGIASGGTPVVERAYGMADLEHDVPNAPDTIFEAGSVSKQFTAMAVLLLARDGKLSLDDPARKYLPELPDYGSPLTIRHMLTHTSGLRDWGEVEAIAGWPRTSRAYTHAHVLDIVSRQKALNFAPGTEWSYTNTGYNLAVVIVSRVSGKPFAEFTRERIFQPLGMTHTSWRDDFTRVVKHRAIAYSQASDGWHQEMPFENVHGNGGLLTTVGDLLKWNENFVNPTVGEAKLIAEEQTVSHLSSGDSTGYAFGLFVGTYRGLREVSHSGSTAGYRAFLTRFPDQHLSVAVLCNAGTANPTQYAHEAVARYLALAFTAAEPTGNGAGGRPATTWFTPAEADLREYVGRYASEEAETELDVELENGALVVKRRPDTVLQARATEKDTFAVPSLGTVAFRRAPDGHVAELSVKLDRVWDLRFQRR